MVKVETAVESSPASTNLVSGVWVELEGGLSLSCPGVKCGRTEVHTPPETQEAGRPVELKEATTGMKQLHRGHGGLHTSLRSGPVRPRGLTDTAPQQVPVVRGHFEFQNQSFRRSVEASEPHQVHRCVSHTCSL